MNEIAVYGKGGIGKSTMSANISAALSEENIKVLQIGCDPKHDSTRLLLGGRRIETVLDYIRETGPLDYRLEDILSEGYNKIGCIEAGGPKPGVGCAGRGIITAFELLEKFHIKESYDMIIYDVLGDVVCGGFAVPIRREYADTIFIVTSGEYMSIYAANNILRGIKNYDGDNQRVAGIIYNSRNVRGEDEKVKRFAEAVGLPIFAKIPRSDVFASAERENCTVIQYEPDSEVSGIFRTIARKIIKGPTLHTAKPLTDEELELLIMYGEKAKTEDEVKSDNLCAGSENLCDSSKCTSEGCESSRVGSESSFAGSEGTCEDSEGTSPDGDCKHQDCEKNYECGYLSKNVIRNEPLHGCAYNGATSMSVHLTDAVILTHSPKACTYISYQSISSSGRRRLFERGTLLPVSIMPNIVSTDMDESDMVFGGMEKLIDAVIEIKESNPRPKAIIIISSCPSGIIGDDIEKAKELADDNTKIVTIKADGNLTGDYLQGMLMSYIQLAEQIVDPDIKPVSKTVNIVFEKVVAKNTDSNFAIIENWLSEMGIRVNCRFLCNTTFDALKNFCSAELNLLAHNDYTGKILREFFESGYGCRFYDGQFPVGFAESEIWLRDIGSFFGEEKIAESIIERARSIYKKRMESIREKLQGKKLMIVTYAHNLDWILQTALDAGMEIVKLCILNFSQDEGFRTSIPEVWDIPREEDYNRENRQVDMEKYNPDIILSNYETAVNYRNCVADVVPMCPDIGFFSGLIMAERWAGLFVSELEGEWKNDRELFDKYYSR